MKKQKTIKVEIGPEELAEIIFEWTAKRPTPQEAARLLADIQEIAQAHLDRAVFTVITDLYEGS